MFLNLIPSEFYPVISDYIKILIPAIITYVVTRYSLIRPHKYEIRKNQFDKVYLPLYLLTKQYLCFENKIDELSLSLFIKKTEKLFYKSYPYVYPKTIKLFTILKEESFKKSPNIYHLTNFEYQVNYDYEKLKRDLGYPASSFVDFFKRLNTLNKILYSLFLLFGALTIFALVSSFMRFLDGDILNGFSGLFVAALISFLLYIFSYITKR